jgi:hypothetical protein
MKCSPFHACYNNVYDDWSKSANAGRRKSRCWLLRDALGRFIGGETGGNQPAEGVAGLVAQGISWVLILCSRWCGGGGAGEGGGEEETPPSPAGDLKDALDEFLDHLDPTWLDDLVSANRLRAGNPPNDILS